MSIQEKTSLIRMTQKSLQDSCKKNKLYITPHLNDTLYLHFSGYEEIECLEEYTGLKCLWLESNAIGKISGLGNQKELKCLFLQQNLIKKIENLGCCDQLDTLNLSHNYITKIENCGSAVLPVLNTLNLANNCLRTLESVQQLTECRSVSVLDLGNNRIEDVLIVKVLGRMEQLRVLVLTGNPVVNSIPNYRKTLILECKNLTNLDNRPVFERDRAGAEAWKIGGYEAEMKVNRKFVRREQNKIRRSVNATLAIRKKNGSSNEPPITLLSTSEDESEDEQKICTSQDQQNKLDETKIVNVTIEGDNETNEQPQIDPFCQKCFNWSISCICKRIDNYEGLFKEVWMSGTEENDPCLYTTDSEKAEPISENLLLKKDENVSVEKPDPAVSEFLSAIIEATLDSSQVNSTDEPESLNFENLKNDNRVLNFDSNQEQLGSTDIKSLPNEPDSIISEFIASIVEATLDSNQNDSISQSKENDFENQSIQIINSEEKFTKGSCENAYAVSDDDLSQDYSENSSEEELLESHDSSSLSFNTASSAESSSQDFYSPELRQIEIVDDECKLITIIDLSVETLPVEKITDADKCEKPTKCRSDDRLEFSNLNDLDGSIKVTPDLDDNFNLRDSNTDESESPLGEMVERHSDENETESGSPQFRESVSDFVRSFDSFITDARKKMDSLNASCTNLEEVIKELEAKESHIDEQSLIEMTLESEPQSAQRFVDQLESGDATNQQNVLSKNKSDAVDTIKRLLKAGDFARDLDMELSLGEDAEYLAEMMEQQKRIQKMAERVNRNKDLYEGSVEVVDGKVVFIPKQDNCDGK